MKRVFTDPGKLAGIDMGIVYSTEKGGMCPDCGMPFAGCVCGPKKPIRKGDGIVRVGRETKGRKGKGVTTITGLALSENGLLELARKLKRLCGSGGTVKDGVIEIQGEHRDRLVEELQKQGYPSKRSGG
jgi:translation initiation factor 1